RDTDKDRVRARLPAKRDFTGDLNPHVAEDSSDGKDPLKHRKINLIPDKLLKGPETPVVFPERVIGVHRCTLKRHHLTDVDAPDHEAGCKDTGEKLFVFVVSRCRLPGKPADEVK